MSIHTAADCCENKLVIFSFGVIVMKRVICLLLVMVLCMYIPCVALAATPSPGESAPTEPSTPSGPPSETRDNSHVMLWVIIMVVALLAIVALVVAFRKFVK